MKHAIRIAGALALASGLGSAWAGDVTVKDTKNLIDDGIINGSLTKIQEQPQAFYKSRVRFEARFDKFGEIHQPFFTIFDSRTHVNFAAWDVETDLRTADGYADVCKLLYLDRRRGDEAEALFDMHKFQRFECVGVVQSIFGGQAFIEVLTLKPLDRTWAPDMHKRHTFGLAQPAIHSRDPNTADPCECLHTPKYEKKAAAATEAAVPTTVEATTTIEAAEAVA
ncbi:MAG: hypothetical protein ACF8XB_04660, partial [Planctomycetota bacterium JB042]